MLNWQIVALKEALGRSVRAVQVEIGGMICSMGAFQFVDTGEWSAAGMEQLCDNFNKPTERALDSLAVQEVETFKQKHMVYLWVEATEETPPPPGLFSLIITLVLYWLIVSSALSLTGQAILRSHKHRCR